MTPLVEAVRFYREAMEVLCQLPPNEENKREQIETGFVHANPLEKNRLFGRLSSPAAKGRSAG